MACEGDEKLQTPGGRWGRGKGGSMSWRESVSVYWHRCPEMQRLTPGEGIGLGTRHLETPA